MLGIGIGILCGALQFWLLFIGVKSVGAQALKFFPMIAQFFCPFIGLFLCALLARDQLLPCAICIIVILIAGAVVNALIYIKNSKKDGKK